ncbi:MAG: Mur ligase family protein [Chlamydiia bacterium]
MLALALTAVGLWSTAKITLRFLQFFQQEEYDGQRFLSWWWTTRSFERRLSLGALLCSALMFLGGLWHEEIPLIVASAGAIVLLFMGLQVQFGPSKKKLRITGRIQRLIAVITLLQGGALLSIGSFLSAEIVAWPLAIFLMIQATPLIIATANLLLWPLERLVRYLYLQDGRRKINRLQPVVIGITGSYGKTSTKNLVAQVCGAAGLALPTPSSVNTLMGVTRVIREQLLPEHRFFVVEMGAYRQGSIKALCDLTRPRIAVLTCIGIAHLERFRSIEVVAQAKAELAQSLPPHGCLIYNADDPFCRLIASQVHCATLAYGTNREVATLDLWMKHLRQVADGIEVEWVYQNRSYHAKLPLHGVHQASNASAALLAGVACDLPFVQGIAALRSVLPTPHRCQVSQVHGVTWIDDSYNSNPVGFRNALEVLKSLPGTRSYLVTPGMVELGEVSDAEHAALATSIAQSADHVCLVASHRLSALAQALTVAGVADERVHLFSSFLQAREWLLQELQPGDKVLLENDLPDLHERSSAF